MKIQLASDLHTESLADAFPGDCLLTPAADADLLVLAGDIAVGANAVELLADWEVPVLYVAGNHEFYGLDVDDVEAQLRHAAEGTRVHFLEMDAVVLDGCRFLGTTLWTDYGLYEARGVSVDAALSEARMAMMDHKVIRYGGFRFAPVDALMRHEASLAWLKDQLARAFDVDRRRHSPRRPFPVDPSEIRDERGQFGLCQQSRIAPVPGAAMGPWPRLRQPRLPHPGSRVVANPRGYPLNRHVNTASWLRFENEAFDPAVVIEV